LILSARSYLGLADKYLFGGKMLFNKILGHCSFLGHTGYANHSRNFFTTLNNYLPVRIHNFSWWKELDHLDLVHHRMLIKQTWEEPPWEVGVPFYRAKSDKIISIVLMETNHYYYYDSYQDPVIGYNVWEATKQPQKFFDRWNKFLQLWVPTEWQRQCTIEQGADPTKVKVVPEGVDGSKFFPGEPELKLKEYKDGRFKFMIFGRWDYRKSTTEMIRTFLETFNRNESVDLIISVDNPFPADGLKSTEERLKHHKLVDSRIKILHFPNNQEYISHLKSGHCLLTCSRAEGWNLPLIEGISCGTPTISSNYGAQLEFAENISHMVDIKDHISPREVFMDVHSSRNNNLEGTWAEPDFEHLSKVMRDVYENYEEYKIKALVDSKIVREKFTWENAAKTALEHISEITEDDIEVHKRIIKKSPSESVKYTFHNGARVDIFGSHDQEYTIKFIDNDTQKLVHQDTIETYHYVKTSRMYYTNWKVIVEVNEELYSDHIFNPYGKRVIITLDSSALGDTISWMPYVEEFRKKHNCKVFCSTLCNNLFKNGYPEIEFIPFGTTIDDIYAIYNVSMEEKDYNRNKTNWHLIPLQQAGSDFLGLDFKEIRPIIQVKKFKRAIKQKYVAIAEHSTFQCKYWNHPTGWQDLVKYLNSVGYQVMPITREKSYLKNVVHKPNKELNDIVNNIQNAEFFIGVSSGLAWLAWGLQIPTVIISGCTKPFVEMQDCIRVHNPNVCNGCFNDPNIDLDKPNWEFCPRKQNYICSTAITPEMVIEAVQPLIKED